MQIKVEVNGLIYDSGNKACKCILADSQGKLFAFIQVLDGSLKKRYWGEYSHDYAEASIRAIMEHGGKWPVLPQ
ncbi:hypothetical protein [Citrobacter portucalensis]|uniref:hypothetical protein n=1 Tax=Citrobacter portucalensis TaxID=1639133 RepID=UPI002B239B0B|nr:hypothetical protein [Citrobacter portucalensis]MEB0982848.1 hypothetical protein [Citrobacter portucalensis]